MVDIKFHCDDKNNFQNGFSVRAFVYTDYSIEMHSHDFYEVNIILSGSGTHCIENGRFSVNKGDVFVIPPMVAHAYIETQNLDVYHILLKKSFIDKCKVDANKVNGFLQLTEIEPFLRSNFANAFFLHLNDFQLMQLKNDLDIIDNHSIFSWKDCELLKYCTMQKILYWFSELLYRQMNSDMTKNRGKYEGQIVKALEYIHENYNEKITIETLCKEVFLSRSTFLRNFREICGETPLEYLNRYRCQKAIQLFEAAVFSKTEIAHTCGFYDLSHMERMLKKYR